MCLTSMLSRNRQPRTRFRATVTVLKYLFPLKNVIYHQSLEMTRDFFLNIFKSHYQNWKQTYRYVPIKSHWNVCARNRVSTWLRLQGILVRRIQEKIPRPLKFARRTDASVHSLISSVDVYFVLLTCQIMVFFRFVGPHFQWTLSLKKVLLYKPDRYHEQSSLQVNSFV